MNSIMLIGKPALLLPVLRIDKTMKMMFKLASTSICAILSVGLLGSQSGSAATLDFSGLRENLIPQTYGDVPGLLDITYRGLSGPGNSSVIRSSLNYWSSGYSNLTGVAYGPGGRGTAEIVFLPLNGATINLLNFQLGAYISARNSRARVFSLDYSTVLFDSGDITVLNSTASSFAPNIIASDGFRLQFGPDGYNVGIDNINYSISTSAAIPTPSLLPGLVGMGLAAYRKRRAMA